jgi:3-oxoacyl-[acyl-carrier-protein] synthase-3
MGESALRALQKCGINSEEVDLFVPHQANIRIIDAAAKRLNLPTDKVFVNVQKYGNTSAASIPIALCEALEEGRVRPGDTIVTVGFGGGLTWASCVMKWPMR